MVNMRCSYGFAQGQFNLLNCSKIYAGWFKQYCLTEKTKNGIVT
ncbi:hypothetical protein PPAR_a3173 [Pseudoalteromonas paragorgicola KMM 3548]|nr:hypothetical protein PH505_ad00680 [Pseudoalteromonas distincta]MBE3674444.1 hypothetical protein [Pseudoalteromonas distincta KMM 3548]